MLFYWSLYIALAIFALGVLYRFSTWFLKQIGPEAAGVTGSQRFAASFKGLFSVLFSRRLLTVLKVLVVEVILQVQVLKADRTRWLMHMCIYVGFMLLLIFHALSALITKNLVSGFEPTLNPFLFLRNFFGLMVVAGLIIAWYRRRRLPMLRVTTGGRDTVILVLLAVIMVSGFLLEGVKITSYAVYDKMVEEYATLGGDDEANALKAYWARDFGVVFPGDTAPPQGADLKLGRDLHDSNCAGCHDRPQWAFISYPAAKVIGAAGRALYSLNFDIWGLRLDVWLWRLHYLISFLALAYLPFGKFFHILASPVSLIARGVTSGRGPDRARMLSRRAMELDACTHCAACSLHCSVGPIFSQIPNINILPSEKLKALNALASGRKLTEAELRNIQEGSFICTNCYRCTTVCPVGINLQDLWLSMKAGQTAQGYPEPQAWVREKGAAELAAFREGQPEIVVSEAKWGRRHMRLTDDPGTFAVCFECQACTNACPVVANYDDPGNHLDLLPHQITHALNLGQRDLVLGSRMIWDCLTCYLCQEHCPQGVRVTDVLYELKNIAYQKARVETGAGPLSKKEGPDSAGDGERL